MTNENTRIRKMPTAVLVVRESKATGAVPSRFSRTDIPLLGSIDFST